MLRYRASTNFDQFKRKLIVAYLVNYGNLGRLIQDDDYYQPPAVVGTAFGDLSDDPNGIKRSRLLKAYEARDKKVRNMEKDRVKMYGYIWQN